RGLDLRDGALRGVVDGDLDLVADLAGAQQLADALLAEVELGLAGEAQGEVAHVHRHRLGIAVAAAVLEADTAPALGRQVLVLAAEDLQLQEAVLVGAGASAPALETRATA